ncbi:MAG: LysM peptidoglycan-binding domain-containing protein, partial [Bacteroidota bacterium]
MRSILSLLIFTSSIAFSQTVPREMNFGGMRLTLTEGARRQIQRDVDRLTNSQTYYQILVDRMNLYFPIIEKAFAENDVPDEIKFLAIQESALISDAVSSANAVGFWQFKDFTAREVGLRVDRSVDERLNIVGASYGASKYLNSNNFFYNNWIYSVMAYNTGRGGAKKYIDESNYGTKRMTINTQTHWYVKKFLAHVVAFQPSVGLPHSQNIWLDEDKKARGMSLAQVARKHKVNVEEVKKYNKWLKRGSVPDDKEYTVLIPKIGTPPQRMIASNKRGNYGKISEPNKKIYPTELIKGITDADKSTIIPLNGIPSILSRQSDDIHSLSARAGISETRFMAYNDLGATDAIVPNEFYYVKKKKNKSKIGFHVVQKGQSLWSVSQQYGIQLSKLAKKNRMSVLDKVKEGRVLFLKKTRPADIAPTYQKDEVEETDDPVKYDESDKINVPVVDSSKELRKVKIHTVASGESLWSISKKYNVLLEDLLRWNELPNPDALHVGQNIQVKAPVEEAIANKKLGTHTVEPGETLYA